MKKENKCKEKSEKELLKEISKKLNAIVVNLALREKNSDNQIKILCSAGFKSEEIGKIIGITGRGVRKNKAYKE